MKTILLSRRRFLQASLASSALLIPTSAMADECDALDLILGRVERERRTAGTWALATPASTLTMLEQNIQKWRQDLAKAEQDESNASTLVWLDAADLAIPIITAIIGVALVEIVAVSAAVVVTGSVVVGLVHFNGMLVARSLLLPQKPQTSNEIVQNLAVDRVGTLLDAIADGLSPAGASAAGREAGALISNSVAKFSRGAGNLLNVVSWSFAAKNLIVSRASMREIKACRAELAANLREAEIAVRSLHNLENFMEMRSRCMEALAVDLTSLKAQRCVGLPSPL